MFNPKMKPHASLILLVFLVYTLGCLCGEEPGVQVLTRAETIPSDAVKYTPERDEHPPILHVDGWENPVPLAPPVNTAGAEDSAFVTPDGNTLYFFFTPDVRVPVDKQVIDGVTGIWVSKKVNGAWSEPERVILHYKDKLSLDGCEFVQNGVIWFCSAREGYTGVNFFRAYWRDGAWRDYEYVGDRLMKEFEMGELHISSDGSELYFHSPRAGGKGGYDLWTSKKVEGVWTDPVNLEVVNSPDTDGWPYLTSDGGELWFTRTYLGSPAIFRSTRVNGEFQEPELIVSQFAGEPTLDDAGNLYFTHHYYKNGEMQEADIYVAYKK
ncbi:MAG TPA: hypothetical protein ENN13_01430 [Candidatus Altiarchaeales archaeon]|nr:hypothetical protein [Candidatus Altiarchaeales archaeon]